MAAPVRCELVPSHPPGILDEVCRIYRTSIPPSESKPVDAVRAMATRPDYRLIAAMRGDAVLGFAALFAPPDEPCALLEYLAVDEASRGAGIGGALFRAAVDEVSPRGAILLVEVEAEFGAGDELEQRRRRQAFYRRLGCRRVTGLRYQLPLRTAGKPPPMDLMIYPPAVTEWRLDRHAIESALRHIYKIVYAQPADDPRIARMVANLSAVPDTD